MASLPPRSAYQQALQRHHSAVGNQHYGDITFRGVEFRGVSVTRNEGELRNEDGGLLDASELVVCVSKSRLSQAPKVNEQLGYGGETWLIRSVAGLMQWEQEWILKVSK